MNKLVTDVMTDMIYENHAFISFRDFNKNEIKNIEREEL